jgi:hypothetical protein
VKPFSTYPEDRAKLIALCGQIESSTLVDDTAVAADNLASLVRAILEDEAIAINSAPPSDGGPAFPLPEARDANDCGIYEAQGGMTKREWFAGQFLAGAVASPDNNGPLDVSAAADQADIDAAMVAHWAAVSRCAVIAADAMLAALGKAVRS